MAPHRSYASYLLRLRKLHGDGQATWVASVQSVASDDHRSFPSVEALAAYLLAEFASPAPSTERGTGDAESSRPMGE